MIFVVIVIFFLATGNRKQVLIAFDQMINARLGGYADETLSARSWRMRHQKKRYAAAVKVIDCIFFWQVQHCYAAYESERTRRQMPPEYRSQV